MYSYVLLGKKKILPVKPCHTIIKCIPISDTLNVCVCVGGVCLKIDETSISAAVNSDTIEDSSFQPER